MSEKSVSRAAEDRREKDHEASRKKTSLVKAVNPKPTPDDGFTREGQRELSVGEGNSNLGSNRNAGRVSEQEQAPENAVGYTPDQSQRDHARMPVAGEGSIDNRSVGKSGATLGRHVHSDDGFKIAERRSASVTQNRKETEKVFDSHRKTNRSV